MKGLLPLLGKEVLQQFEDGRRDYVFHRDVFATGQTVLVMAAPGREASLALRVRQAGNACGVIDETVQRQRGIMLGKPELQTVTAAQAPAPAQVRHLAGKRRFKR